MKLAIAETDRRRLLQQDYNAATASRRNRSSRHRRGLTSSTSAITRLHRISEDKDIYLSPHRRKKRMDELAKLMKEASAASSSRRPPPIATSWPSSEARARARALMGAGHGAWRTSNGSRPGGRAPAKPASTSSRAPRARSSTSARPARSATASVLFPGQPDVKVAASSRDRRHRLHLTAPRRRPPSSRKLCPAAPARFNLRSGRQELPVSQAHGRRALAGRLFQSAVEPDGSRYFGPFSPAGRARSTIHLVNKYFRVRAARRRLRPQAACWSSSSGSAPRPAWARLRSRLPRERRQRLPLPRGRLPELARTLRARMELAAESEKFEEAARWRDVLRTIEDIRDRPSAISTALETRTSSVWPARRRASHTSFSCAKQDPELAPLLDASAGTPNAELLAGFLGDFYRTRAPPASSCRVPGAFGPTAVALAGPRSASSCRAAARTSARRHGGRNAESFLRRQSGDSRPSKP